MSAELPSPDPLTPEQQWMKAWRSAAIELPKIRANELKQLDDAKVFELMGGTDAFEVANNGLAIQQAWFSRFHILELQQALLAAKNVKS